MKNLRKGVILMLFCWSLFAVTHAISKHVCHHTTASVAVLFQNGIGFLCLLPFLARRQTSLFRGGNWPLLFARAMTGTLTFYSLFYALKVVPLTDAILLANTGPLFVPLLVLLFLRKKSPLRLCLSGAIGFLGILWILQPSQQIFQFGSLFALLAGLFTGGSMVSLSMMRHESPERVVFVYLFTAALAALPFALPDLPSLPLAALPYLIASGVIFAIGQMLYTYGSSCGDAATLAPFSYMLVLSAVFLDWLIWDRAPTSDILIGITLVMVGGILTLIWGHSKREEMRTERDSNP